VRFCDTRSIKGFDNDIFLNRRNLLKAGLTSRDAVLGSSGSSPGLRDEE